MINRDVDVTDVREFDFYNDLTDTVGWLRKQDRELEAKVLTYISNYKRALMLAGKMASSARALVGGNGMFGTVAPADIETISRKARHLREQLGEYDYFIEEWSDGIHD